MIEPFEASRIIIPADKEEDGSVATRICVPVGLNVTISTESLLLLNCLAQTMVPVGV